MENSRLRLGCAALLLVPMAGLYWYLPRWAERSAEAARESGELDPEGQVQRELSARASDPVEVERRLSQLAHTAPDQAMAEAKRLLEGDGGQQYEAVGRAVLPRALDELAQRAAKQGEYKAAEAAVAELASLGGAEARVSALRKVLDDALGERLWKTTSRGQWGAAEGMAKALLARGETPFGRGGEALKVLAEQHAGQFAAKEARQDPSANAHLEIALALTRNLNGSRIAEVTRSWGPQKLLARADFFSAADKPLVVAALYELAAEQVEVPSVTGSRMDAALQVRAELKDKGAAAKLRLLGQLVRSGNDWISFRRGLEIAQEVQSHARDSRREDLRRKREDRAAQWRERMSEGVSLSIRLRGALARAKADAGDLDGALQELDNLARQGGFEVAELKIEQPDWKGWAELPEELRAELASRKINDPESWRRQAAQYVYSGRWRPDLPELRDAAALESELRLEKGLSLVSARVREERERGQDLLRGVLRSGASRSAKQRMQSVLQEKLRAAGEALEFEILLDLCAFYAAELEPPGKEEPFHAELLELLVKSADHHREAAPLQRLFLLTLLADLFPDEPQGEAARAEALEKFFEVVELAHPDHLEPPLLLPSGVAGRSVNAIDNATRYHLLVFFEGPEKFFVRVPPVRRGSIVLLNGHYKVAAMVTSAGIVPSRGEMDWTSSFMDSKYKIVTTSNGKTTDNWAEAAAVGGKYLLLRAPANESYEIDPASGVARASSGVSVSK